MEEAARILKEVPHRYPFLMVDRVLEVVPGKRASALKSITRDTMFDQGRPGAFYPELLMLEALAQLGAVVAGGKLPGGLSAGEKGPEPGLLAALSDARFHRRPSVGDVVTLTVDFEAKMGGLVRFTGRAMIGDEVAAESALIFSVPGMP